MMSEMTRPERVLYFLLPGRLVSDENGNIEIWLLLKCLRARLAQFFRSVSSSKNAFKWF